MNKKYIKQAFTALIFSLVIMMVFGNFTYADTEPLGVGSLTVVKHVVNNHGGTKTAGDFTMHIISGTLLPGASDYMADFPGSEDGVIKTDVQEGDYIVNEDELPNYAASYSADCSGHLSVGESKTCTITNTDIGAKLKVIKIVSGGDKSPSNFTLTVSGPSEFNQSFTGSEAGENLNDLSAGNYTVSESAAAGYTASFSGDCDSSGNITLNLADNKTCTVTNTYSSEGGGDSGIVLTVSKSGTGGGTITSDDGFINCGELCSHSYASGTAVSLTATPSNDSTFSDTWTSGPCSGSNNPTCTFVVSSSMSVNAHFSLNSGGGGSSGGSGSGGGPSGGGIAAPTPIPSVSGQVAGASITKSPDSPDLSNQPQVLGAATTLPRTGGPLWPELMVLAAAIGGAFKFGRKLSY